MVAVPTPNEHGVFLPDQCETVISDRIENRSEIIIYLIQIGADDWISNSRISLPDRAAGGYPSISRHTPHFADRYGAFFYELDYAMNFCRRAISDRSTSKVCKSHARRLLRWCVMQCQTRFV